MRYAELMDAMPLCISNGDGSDNTTGGPFTDNPTTTPGGDGGETDGDGFVESRRYGLFGDDEW